MHGNEIIYVLICTKNHVLLCQFSMLSVVDPAAGLTVELLLTTRNSPLHRRDREDYRLILLGAPQAPQWRRAGKADCLRVSRLQHIILATLDHPSLASPLESLASDRTHPSVLHHTTSPMLPPPPPTTATTLPPLSLSPLAAATTLPPLAPLPLATVPLDEWNHCGHQLHYDSCQIKVQTYQFNENNSNFGV